MCQVWGPCMHEIKIMVTSTVQQQLYIHQLRAFQLLCYITRPNDGLTLVSCSISLKSKTIAAWWCYNPQGNLISQLY